MSELRPVEAPRCRAAIVLDHPAQHFVAAFILLSTNPEIDTEIMYWDPLHDPKFSPAFGIEVRWDVELTSSYPVWYPSNKSAISRLVQCLRHLILRKPDVILCYGWSTPISRLAILYATIRRTPILYYGDSTWQHSTRPRIRRVRKVVLHRLFKRKLSGALATGSFNREFYLMNGMEPHRVFPGVCPVDTEPFIAARRRRCRSNESDNETQPDISIAFAGKFIDRKAPAHLIEAVALLPTDLHWHLTMVGDGPLRAQLEQLVEDLDLSNRVTFAGFKNTSQMPDVLAQAHILVVPSTRDLRVLVTTEAMAAGAVPVVSDATAVWGAGDLIEHGVTGMVYPSGDIPALSRCLAVLINDGALRERLADAALGRSTAHDSDDFAHLAAEAFLATARSAQRALI